MLADFNTNLLILVIGGVVAYLAVLWVALAFYVVRDARRRSTSVLFALFAAVLGFLPPFLGPLIYLVIRPPRTLDEERQLELEEEALREMDAEEPTTMACSACGREIEREFVLCPHCRTQFAKRCPGCSRVLRLGWEVCPYCAEEVGIPGIPAVRTARPVGSGPAGPAQIGAPRTVPPAVLPAAPVDLGAARPGPAQPAASTPEAPAPPREAAAGGAKPKPKPPLSSEAVS